MVTGSAPLAKEVLEFLSVVACCPLVEGYGQTESCAASFVTEADDPTSGHCGGPVASTEFKLVDVPELDYLSTDKDKDGNYQPRGEICLKGASVFKGYYKD